MLTYTKLPEQCLYIALCNFLLRGDAEAGHVQWSHPHCDLSHPV